MGVWRYEPIVEKLGGVAGARERLSVEGVAISLGFAVEVELALWSLEGRLAGGVVPSDQLRPFFEFGGVVAVEGGEWVVVLVAFLEDGFGEGGGVTALALPVVVGLLHHLALNRPPRQQLLYKKDFSVDLLPPLLALGLFFRCCCGWSSGGLFLYPKQ